MKIGRTARRLVAKRAKSWRSKSRRKRKSKELNPLTLKMKINQPETALSKVVGLDLKLVAQERGLEAPDPAQESQRFQSLLLLINKKLRSLNLS